MITVIRNGTYFDGTGAKGQAKDIVIKDGLIDSIHDRAPHICLLYTSPSPRDRTRSRMPSSA